jgi:hypothetical protein
VLARKLTFGWTAKANDAAFGVVVAANNERTVVIAGVTGAILALILQLLSGQRAINTDNGLVVSASDLLTGVIQPILTQAAGAVALSLLAPYIRGALGVTKGFFLAAGIVLCEVPGMIAYGSLPTAASVVISTLIFYGLIGLTLDICVLRTAGVPSLTIQRLLRFSGLGNYAFLGTLLAGGVLGTLTGEIKFLLPSLLKAAYPQLFGLHLPTQ